MKRILTIIAAGIMMMLAVACSNDPGKKAVKYMEDLMEAEKKGDTEKVEKITKEMEEWAATLSEEDAKKAEEAVEKWMESLEGSDAAPIAAISKDPAKIAVKYMEDYLAVLKAGDTEKAEKIEKEMDEWSKTLSKEDEKKAEQAIEDWSKEHMAEILSAAMGSLE
ncbi:MAG: hypothetical protein J6W74_01175 [Bacteroidales bacterium]|nr:hypothetical protein [Bacteroidales bacterium]